MTLRPLSDALYQPSPVRLTTGRFAPPDVSVAWQLPMSLGVVVVTVRPSAEGAWDDIRLAIQEGGRWRQ